MFQDPKTGTCEDLTILENFALAYGRTAPRGFRFATDRAMRDAVAERLKVLDLGLEVEDLLRLFRQTQGEELSDDSLLLG